MLRADYISFEVCKTLQLSILLKLFLSEESAQMTGFMVLIITGQ